MMILDPAFLQPTVTVALSETTTRYDDGVRTDVSERFQGGQRISVDAGLTVRRDLSIALHGAIAITSMTQAVVQQLSDPSGSVSAHYFTYDYRPYEVGIGAAYTLANRVWFSPWLGLVSIHTAHLLTNEQPKTFGFGAQVGVDLFVSRRERLSLVITSTYAEIAKNEYQPAAADEMPTVDPHFHEATFAQFGIGLAYRHY